MKAKPWRYYPPKGYTIDNIHISDKLILVISKSRSPWQGDLLTALNFEGRLLWQFKSDDKTRQPFHSVRSSPDNTIYLKQGDKILFISPSGKLIKNLHLPLLTSPFFHVILGNGSQLFVNDNFTDGISPSYFCRVSQDGHISKASLPPINTFPAETNDLLVYGGPQGEVYGIDLKTEKFWKTQTDSIRGHNSPWIGADGNIYISGRYGDNTLYCISPQGKILWQNSMDDAPLAITPDHNPYHTDKFGNVYYLSSKQKMMHILPTGKKKVVPTVPPHIDSFTVSPQGTLYRLSENSLYIQTPSDNSVRKINFQLDDNDRWELITADEEGHLLLKNDEQLLEIDLSQNIANKLIHLSSTGNSSPQENPPRIVKGKEWVIIGGVKIPVNTKL